jgi:hypothetical protein
MPAGNYDSLSYTLTFVSGGSTVGPIAVTDGNGAADLEAGTWDLQAEGFQGQTKVLVGSVTGIKVEAGQNTSVSVAMKTNTEGGSGTLDYSVTFPDTVSKALLRVYGWDDWALKETVVLLDTPESSSGTVSSTGSMTLPAGYYQVILDLFKTSGGDGVLSQCDIVHIYPGMNTSTAYPSFEDTDFAQADIDDTQLTFAAVLGGIAAFTSDTDKVYILPPGSESLSLASVSNTNNIDVTITVDGGGRVVTLDNDGSLLTIGGGVTLKLKNITLQGRGTGISNNSSLVTVNGGTLELHDGAFITENTTNSYSGGGVYVDGSGKFIMSGGKISGNSAHSGGGVYVSNSGNFTMDGGEISGNSASDYGGGVYFNSSGTFTMSGGEISDNTVSSYGGGVFFNSSGTFTMSGGKISDNSASYGGGVYVTNSGTFTMNNGEIAGNSASDYGGGGGVYVSNSGNFTMNSGKISGNSASSYYGGGVYVEGSGTFTMSGGEISDNTASSYGGGVYCSSGNFTMTDGEISDNSASSGGGVYVSNSGNFTISGGKIAGNSASSSGGGVYVSNSGNFTMSGGEITGNLASSGDGYSSYGGGVSVESGTFTISGGEILGNSASYGGGVYVGSGTLIKQGGTIYGDTDAVAGNGSVTDNTAVSGDGHAVFLVNGGKRRNATAGPSVKLYARFDSSNYTWTYDGDMVPGINMDTLINWE